MPYLGLIYLVILVAALVDIIGTDEWRVQGLPKVAWVILVVVLPLLGALLWLAFGRPTAADGPRRGRRQPTSEFPEYDRPGRHIAQDPESDREFLQRLRERAEQQRLEGERQRRAADQAPKPDDETDRWPGVH